MLQQNSTLLCKMYTPAERRLTEVLEPERSYSRREFEAVIEAVRSETGETLSADNLFHRGVIDLCEGPPGCGCSDDQNYQRGTFLRRLDIFATEEYEVYSELPEELKTALDDMYFEDYLSWLKILDGERPTEDEVLPVEDVLAFIDGRDDTPYLANCDCRSLKQACDAPRNVCITYRTAPNSYVRRGLAVPITKEEAKAVVMRAEEEGLIHTVNPGGICSCCTDCCYLFRAAEARGSLGVWPKVNYKIEIDEELCIDCGICSERCRFEDICVGCGLCVSTCPMKAIKLVKIK